MAWTEKELSGLICVRHILQLPTDLSRKYKIDNKIFWCSHQILFFNSCCICWLYHSRCVSPNSGHFAWQMVIVWELNRFVKVQRSRIKTLSLQANSLLVINLSTSNLLMGVYLLMLGVSYERLRGSYCFKEVEWRSSGMCTTMGVFVVISMESSVLTTLILASVRLYAILKVISGRGEWYLCLLVVCARCVSVWCVRVGRYFKSANGQANSHQRPKLRA